MTHHADDRRDPTVSLERRARSVSLRGLGKRFGDVVAVDRIDLEVARGELVVLVGPSGCGKTTVLRLIAGLDDPTEGEILIGDRPVADLEPSQRDIAMVFQSYALYPHMTVRQNLGFGLRMRGVPSAAIDRQIGQAAAVLGLAPLLDRRPGELSGGEKQRVAFGRALVRQPSVFLFDEPFSNLDARLRADLRVELAELHDRLGATMLFVTHDQIEAMTLGHRIAVMRGGRLQQCAPPLEVYREPANLFVATFIGTPSINTLAGEIVRAPSPRFEGPGLSLALTHPVEPGAAVLAVRPEALSLVNAHDAAAVVRSRVRRLEPLGNELLVHLETPGGGWIARTPSEAAVRPGDLVGIALEATCVHLFRPPDGARLDPPGSRSPA